MEDQRARVIDLRRKLTDEVVRALGFSADGWARKVLAPVVWLPTYRFSRLAARFDQVTGDAGMPAAARWMLPHLVPGVQVHGAELIPAQGPLLVISNHPGSVDGLSIVAHLPRNDLKVIASAIPFIFGMPAARRHLIYLPKVGEERSTALRQTLRHLQDGGTMLIFPGGKLDPDPAVLPGAHDALGTWSRSLELMLRRVPDTQVLVTIVSGVLAPRWLRHPIVRLRRGTRERQLLAEFLQTIQMLVIGRKPPVLPQVTFSPPVTARDLAAGGDSADLLAPIIERARRLLADHLATLYPRQAVGGG